MDPAQIAETLGALTGSCGGRRHLRGRPCRRPADARHGAHERGRRQRAPSATSAARGAIRCLRSDPSAAVIPGISTASGLTTVPRIRSHSTFLIHPAGFALPSAAALAHARSVPGLAGHPALRRPVSDRPGDLDSRVRPTESWPSSSPISCLPRRWDRESFLGSRSPCWASAAPGSSASSSPRPSRRSMAAPQHPPRARSSSGRGSGSRSGSRCPSHPVPGRHGTGEPTLRACAGLPAHASFEFHLVAGVRVSAYDPISATAYGTPLECHHDGDNGPGRMKPARRRRGLSRSRVDRRSSPW